MKQSILAARSACSGLPHCVAAVSAVSRWASSYISTPQYSYTMYTSKAFYFCHDAPFLSVPLCLPSGFSHSSVSPLCCVSVADPGRSVMSARFRLPAGRSYNVRATELERDRQHTQVVCNVLLLDNTVQAFKVSVSTTTTTPLPSLCFTLNVDKSKQMRRSVINILPIWMLVKQCLH